MRRWPEAAAQPDARWDGLMAAVCAYLLFDIGRLHMLFPFVQPLRPALVCAAAAVALCVLRRHVGRELRAVSHPAVYLAGALLLWGAFSVPLGVYPGLSFRFLVGTFLQTLVMALITAIAVRGPRDVKRLLLTFFAAALVYSLVVLARFRVAPGERLAELYTYDANDLALFIACAVPVSLYLILRSPWLVRRALALAGFLVLMVVLVWTGSRGGFLALLTVLLVLVFTWKFIRLPWRILAVSTGLLVFALAGNAQYWKTMTEILDPGEDYNFTSINGRIPVWKRGVGYMLANPVFGVGINAFPSAEGRNPEIAKLIPPGKGFKWSTAHNSFLQVGAELGIPGLMIFLAFAWQLLRTAMRLSSPALLPRPGPTLAGLLVPMVAGFFVAAFFLSQAYGAILYFHAAAIMGLHRIAVRTARARRVPAPQPAPSAVSVHGTALAGA
jgi:O-antigen ligase